MFCKQCGVQLESDSIFCSNCGAKTLGRQASSSTRRLFFISYKKIMTGLIIVIACILAFMLPNIFGSKGNGFLGDWENDSYAINITYDGDFFILNVKPTSTRETSLIGRHTATLVKNSLHLSDSRLGIAKLSTDKLKIYWLGDEWFKLSEEHITAINNTISQNNLKQFGVIFKMYSNENQGAFPPLSKTVGCLMCAKESIYPEYLTEPGIIKSPMYAKVKNSLNTDSIDDNSYVYFGYVFTSPADVEFFLNKYKESFRGECSLEEDLVDAKSDKTVYRLQDGIERFLITDKNDPVAANEAQASVPVMMERRIFYKDGKAPVLFLDGHVQNIGPGENKIIDRVFEILPEFDAMKKQKR